MGTHVFISYRHDDSKAYVERLARHLADHAIPIWYDTEIVSGDRWLDVIKEKVDSCAAFIVVMTPAAEDSAWVDREVSRAQEKGKPILPLLLSGTVFFRLSDMHAENVTNGVLPRPSYVTKLRTLLNDHDPATEPVPPAVAAAPTRLTSALRYFGAAVLFGIALVAVIVGALINSGILIAVGAVMILASLSLASRRAGLLLSRLMRG